MKPQFLVPTVLSGGRDLFFDDFNDTRAAGAVNGTPTTPGPGGDRYVQDTADHLSIDGTNAVIDGNGVTWGDPRIVYEDFPITREAGRFLISLITEGGSNLNWACGFALNTTPTSSIESSFAIQGLTPYSKSTTASLPHFPASSTLDGGVIVLRDNGQFHFAKMDGKWRLFSTSDIGNTATLYIAYTHSHVGLAKNIDYIKIPNVLWSPIPAASDSFDRANGALGNTDGAGHAEANGGDGLAWTNQVGTVQIASNEASASALSGGAAVATVTAHLDAIVSAKVTVGSTSAGVVVRYKDSDNYVYAMHDGTNIKLIKRVGGVESDLYDAAKAYTAGFKITVLCFNTKFGIFYDDKYVTTYQTAADADLQLGDECGVYFGDTDSTCDDFQAWYHGTDDEYSSLQAYNSGASANPGRLLIMFDDGFESVIDEAYAYMNPKGIKATMYITSDYIGTAGYMTWAELQTLDTAGWDIANHSETHTPFAGLSQAAQQAEADNCEAALIANSLPDAAIHIAYPNASNDENTEAAMIAAGMLTGRDVDNSGTTAYTGVDIYLIPCNDIGIAYTLANLMGLVYDALDDGKLAIVLFHSLVETPSAGYEWAIDDFKTFIDFVEARGIETWNISDYYANVLA